jgi:hypothetical protein
MSASGCNWVVDGFGPSLYHKGTGHPGTPPLPENWLYGNRHLRMHEHWNPVTRDSSALTY